MNLAVMIPGNALIADVLERTYSADGETRNL